MEKLPYIKLPTNFCRIISLQNALIDRIFLDVHKQYKNHEWLTQKTILVGKNLDVNDLNFKIQQLLPDDLVSHKSIDEVCDANKAVDYPTKFLNSLDLSSMPLHLFQGKVGSPGYFAA